MMSQGQAMSLLEASGVPKATTMQGRAIVTDRSLHRRLASKVSHRVICRLDYDKWHRTLTKSTLRKAVKKEIRTQFSVVTWLIWGWRIYSWINIIWDKWHDESD